MVKMIKRSWQSVAASMFAALLAVFLAIPIADAADSLPAATSQVNITKINGSNVSATNPMPSELTDGTTFYVGAKTGQFPTALGQTTMAGSLSVAVASNQSALPTNITQVNGAALSATNPVFSQLTDGAAVYVGTKTGQLPTALGQQTMAASVGVVIASNQSTLPFNDAQIAGTTTDVNTGNASAGTQRVVIASNQPTIPVTQGVLSGMSDSLGTTVNIGSGATSTVVCKGTLTVSQPLKLLRARVSGAAMARCTLEYNDNATLTKWASLVTSPATPWAEFACPYGSCALTTSATATTQQIEAVCTNFDSVAQDFTCDVSYCQAASGC